MSRILEKDLYIYIEDNDDFENYNNEKALFKTLENGECTADLGGNLGTKEFADAVIKNMNN